MDDKGRVFDCFLAISRNVIKTVNLMALFSRENVVNMGTGQGNRAPNAHLLSPATAEKIKKGSVHGKADKLSCIP